jgi:hypothetical protein
MSDQRSQSFPGLLQRAHDPAFPLDAPIGARRLRRFAIELAWL